MSFFGKFKGGAVSIGKAQYSQHSCSHSIQGTSGSNGTAAPAKKDPNAPQPTKLEKHLKDVTGPVRIDGSDKFFGFENVSCYQACTRPRH